MLKVYPAIFHEEETYWVEFPDLEGCVTEGSTLEEAMENAQEAMGLYLAALLEENQPLPPATNIKEIKTADVVSYVSVDVTRYRRSTKAVKKTLSIPEWLAIEAEKNNLSLSKVLQDGLKAQLGYISFTDDKL
jgi:predicted RNase H-like HicB family nuclease